MKLPTQRELFLDIVKKANEDPDFRQELLDDAKSALSREFDVDLPDNVNVVVHENDTTTVHLPLPAAPMLLGEGQLDRVSGGGGCEDNTCSSCSPW